MTMFDTHPDRYAFMHLSIDGAVASLAVDAPRPSGPDGAPAPADALRFEAELNDVLQRLPFEHPGVGCVVVSTFPDAGRGLATGITAEGLARMDGPDRLHLLRFANETRAAMEDLSRNEGVRFLAALEGPTWGSGYELALACDEIVLADDGKSTVSLPEVARHGLVPATGGPVRLADKRRVRRDLADLFCADGLAVGGEPARAWRLVDAVVPPNRFRLHVAERARMLAVGRTAGPGTALEPLRRTAGGGGWRYDRVEVQVDRGARVATLILSAPPADEPANLAGALARGCSWWPVALARELDDAMLRLRAREPDVGLWILRSRGDHRPILAVDAMLAAHREHWFVRAAIGLLRRCLARLDGMPRSLLALADEGSCFAGTLFELALAADRSYLLAPAGDVPSAPRVALSEMNFGPLATVQGRTRLSTHFSHREDAVAAAAARVGKPLAAEAAMALGLVTLAPDDLDWDDEIRLAVEERTALSPDALTGMEANLRLPGAEGYAAKIQGRLAALGSWVLELPHATGDAGTLALSRSNEKPEVDWRRV